MWRVGFGEGGKGDDRRVAQVEVKCSDSQVTVMVCTGVVVRVVCAGVVVRVVCVLV